MTNILLLPQLSASFTIANNDDWLDQIQFLQPGEATPLDITGIDFRGVLVGGNGAVLLSMQTADGTLVNGGATGVLSFNVRRFPTEGGVLTCTSVLKPGTAQVELLASADGYYVNLLKLSRAQALIIDGLVK